MRWLALVLLYALSSCAIADDALWSAVGGAWAMRQSKDIRMVSEDVKITLKPKTMHVKATFNFLNEGPAQTVLTAFPESIQDQTEHLKGQPIAILSFRAWVDGKKVPVRHVPMSLRNFDEFAAYSGVWLKEVSFARGGRRRVVCEYESQYAEGREFKNATYILRSGATWKGTIGRCDVTVDWRALGFRGRPEITRVDAPNSGPDARLRPARESWNSASFSFRNLEPKFDLSMTFMDSFWNFRVNGKGLKVLPIDEDGASGISTARNSFNDPQFNLWGMLYLLGTKEDVTFIRHQIDQNQFYAGSVFHIRGRPARFEFPRHLVFRGKGLRLERPMSDPDAPVMYVRDVVKALGGTYRYDARAQRADIRIKW